MTGAAPAPMAAAGTGRRRRRFVVRGVVQGVGFRPFVYATAAALGLTGSVPTTPPASSSRSRACPRRSRPSRAGCVTTRRRWPWSNRIEDVDIAPRGGTGFRIADTSRSAGGRTLASPDVATCADCLRELADPADRRYRHPFITCTNCGPRFTIITALPYDRPPTTMAGFPDVRAVRPRVRRPGRPALPCPADRLPATAVRTLELVDAGGGAATASEALPRRPDVARATAASSRSRASAATTWPATPATRRRSPSCGARKRRGDKPFAVMVADLATARAARRDRRRPRRPARRTTAARSCCCPAPTAVARGSPHRGVRRAGQPRPRRHAAVHAAARAAARPARRPAGPSVLVMTSGNLGGEPIVLRTTTMRSTGSRSSPTAGCATTGRSWCPATTPSCGSSTATSCRSAAPAGTRRCPSRCRSPSRRRWPSAPT